ncbi:MAG: hypothetical protein DRQ46_01600 [Gammaproteobacteria bacterium]|nr:MAG: hypothetical protein DRQ46_01600 [Gammaproteobacteria bacterium]
MYRFLTLFCFVLMPFLFIGCSTAQKQYALDSGAIAVEASVLKNQYTTVEKLLRNTQAENNMFTEQEWRTLNNVDSTIDMLILKYNAMTHFKDTTVSLEDVKFMYGLATDGYTQGREVIYAHWDELQPSTQLMLNAFDTQAVQTSERIKTLLSNPDNKNINETLTLIAGVLGSAVKMLSLVAL